MKNLDIQTYEDTFLNSPLCTHDPCVQPSINPFIRHSMARNKRDELLSMDTKKLLETVGTYYGNNAVMPGEKNLRDLASAYLEHFDNPDVQASAEFLKSDIAHSLAKAAIKETRIKLNGPVSDNIINRGEYDIIGSEHDTHIWGMAAHAYTHETDIVPVSVNSGKVSYEECCLGQVTDGFMKNSNGAEHMEGYLMIRKYPNNAMKCSLVVDTAPDLVQMALEQRETAENDFAAAVESIPVDGPGMEQ